MYTNWGITDGKFEPVDEPGKDCVKVCVGSQCADHHWRAADCSEELPFVCQIDCIIKKTFYVKTILYFAFQIDAPRGGWRLTIVATSTSRR